MTKREQLQEILTTSKTKSEAIEKIMILFAFNKRTIDQNSLYWLWCDFLEKEETGLSKNDFHLIFRCKFLSFPMENYEELLSTVVLKKIKNCQKDMIYFEELPQVIDMISQSTKKLSKKEFIEYLNKIEIEILTEMNIKLPNPEDLKNEL